MIQGLNSMITWNWNYITRGRLLW